MTISKGATLPAATFFRLGDKGVDQVTTAALFTGRKVAFFGLPGAYTGTCSTMHVPSFIRVAEGLRAKGVAEIVCIATDGPHVMDAWAKATGGDKAGITFLSDATGDFTRGIGLTLDVPAIGFFGRSKRYSALAEDGVVTQYNPEPAGSACEISAGETLLGQL
jgi:peroxiredoxin